MIDWMSLRAPLRSNRNEVVRQINRATGEMKEFPQRVTLTGKDGVTKIHVSFVGGGTHIKVSGNPIKFLTGQNVIGITDLVELGYQFLLQISKDLNIVPTDAEVSAWRRGDYRLSRVDIAGYLGLPTPRWKLQVIRALRLKFAALKIDIRSYGFHYVAIVQPGRKRLGAYDKSKQTKGYRDLPSDLVNDARLMKYLDRSLRFEAQYFSTELARRRLNVASQWRGKSVKQMLESELKKAGFLSGGAMQVIKEDAMSHRQFLELAAWKAGVDILDGLAPGTRYRRIKEFEKIGIDVRQPYTGEPVMPLDLGKLIADKRLRVGHPARLEGWPPLRALLGEREESDERRQLAA